MSDFAIVRRSLGSRLFSTVVTVLMVAVSVSLMLVLLTIRDTARDHFSRGTGNAQFLISNEPSPFASVLNTFFYAGAPSSSFDMQAVDRLRSDEFRRFFRFVIPIQMGDSYRGAPVVSTNESFFRFFEPVAGRGFEFAEGRAIRDTYDVVVGSEAARAFRLEIGEEIYLTHGLAGDPSAHVHTEYAFRIVGVLRPTGTSHDRALFATLTSSWILHAHDRRLADAADAGLPATSVSLTQESDLLSSDRKLTSALLSVTRMTLFPQAGYMLRTESGLTVANPSTEIARFEAMLSGIDDLFLAVVAVVMLSSAVAIMLALYNSMDLRRRQIAMLRVFGCSAGRVFSLVVTEAAVIGLAGGVIGLGLGVVGAEVARVALRERVGLILDPSFDPVTLLGLVLAATGLAAAAGVVPAVKTYWMPVAAGLRPLA